MARGGVGTWIYRIALTLALAGAALLRWQLPAVPLFDGDSMGYVFAAISRDAGGPFQSLGSRPFVYPAFVWTCLQPAGSFTAVFYAQTAAGLLALVLYERAWQRAGRYLRLRGKARLACRLLGPVLVAAIGWSATPLRLEIGLRPEAVFPLLSAVSFYTTVRTMEVVRRGRGWRGALWPACLLAVNLLMQVTKPNWGFGVLTASAPVALFLFCSARPLAARLVPIAATAGLAGLLLFLPQARFASTDPRAPLFLWLTLFLWHADAIDLVLEADLARPEPEAPRQLLADLRRLLAAEFAESRADPTRVGYPSLGYNPDRLLYHRPVAQLVAAAHGGDEAQEVAFYSRCYARAWREHPGLMLRKVLVQLRGYYGDPEHVYRFHGEAWDFRELQAEAAELLHSYAANPGSEAMQRAVQAEPFQHLLQRSAEAARGEPHVVRLPQPVRGGAKLLRLTYTPVLLACVVLAMAAWRLRRRRVLRLSAPALLLAVVFYGHNFGHVLTFAVVHAIDMWRYPAGQLAAALFANLFGLVALAYCTALCACCYFARAAQRIAPSSSARNSGSP